MAASTTAAQSWRFAAWLTGQQDIASAISDSLLTGESVSPADELTFARGLPCTKEAVLARLASKKIAKREWLDGMNSVYGVNTKGWSLKHAREELVTQMFMETDNEKSESDDED